MTPAQQLEADISTFYSNPLGYVMYIFPWDTEESIQQVELKSPWKEKFSCKYGPDAWACSFLDALGEEIKKRKFNGRNTVEPIRFSTASGHGIGKTALVAWIIKFILDTRPESKGVVTANTSEQLRTKTWAELGKWNRLSLSENWYEFSSGKGSMSLARKGRFKGTWRCDGLTCREENSEAFQGLHAANSTPFYIFDEASGIPTPIWKARAGGATDGEPMSFDFGNPTRNSGSFFENCVGDQKHRFIVRSIDSRDVQITNKNLFKEWIDDFGEDSDFVKVKVRGIFPAQSSVQFISVDVVDAAMERVLPLENKAPLIIGVDVARFGEDSTVLYPRIGDDARSFPYKVYKGLNTMQVVDRIILMINGFKQLNKKCSALFIDGGSMGSGPIDRLRQLGYNPIEVQFGSSPSNKRYRMLMDELWGKGRDGLKTVCLPKDDALKAQLTQREYDFSITTGRIQLESKRSIKARGGDSPDIADAFNLTYTSEVAYEDMDMQPLSYIHEYDPLNYKEIL